VSRYLVLVSPLVFMALGTLPPAADAVPITLAEPVVEAKSSVNGKIKKQIPTSQGLQNNGKGVSIAAAKVFHPEPNGTEQYKVSREPTQTDNGNKAANAAEEQKLKGLIQTLAFPKGLGLGLGDKIKKDTQPTMDPEAFKEVPKVKDGLPLLAETEALMNKTPPPVEKAKASATQVLTTGAPLTGATFTVEESEDLKPETEANGKGRAAALAINRDPVPIEWSPAVGSFVIVDLSNLSFTVATTGNGTTAFALFGSDVSFISNTLNIDSPEDAATPLYNFLISYISTDGASPVLNFFDFEVFGNQVFDNRGNVGEAAVRSAISTELKPLDDGSIGFQDSYLLGVIVPGNPSASVLFLRDFAATAVDTIVPETPAFHLLVIGLIILAASNRNKLPSI
jgi:hypothetical protein